MLLWIGTRSYGLYLYHWPIYQIIRNIAANKLALHEFVLAMVATCIITELSYRYIETPIRKGQLGELVEAATGGVPVDVVAERRAAQGCVCGRCGRGCCCRCSPSAAWPPPSCKQNDLQLALDERRENTCDVLVDVDCDGVDDFDADGNPIVVGTEAESATEDGGAFEPNEDGSGVTPGDGGATRLPIPS